MAAARRPKISRSRPLSSLGQSLGGNAMALQLDASTESGGLPGAESGRVIDILALSQTIPSQVVSKREQF
jgi:hypothetical protein